MECAPSKNKSIYGCFDTSALHRIIYLYNIKYDDQIKLNGNETDKTLWKYIQSKMYNVCGKKDNIETEICWLDNTFLESDTVLNAYYKPKKPIGKYKWLKTLDITKVLKQYESLFPNFLFFGTVPLDFEEILYEYANINMCKIYDKKFTKIGFVFNLDTSDKKGSHWVCMFIDITPNNQAPYIAYFDSYGHQPPREIYNFIFKLKKQILNCLNINMIIKRNKKRHQYSGSECGMYCVCIIFLLLSGNSFEEINNKRISDEDVNSLRDIFFR